jgi:hypothetical protein
MIPSNLEWFANTLCQQHPTAPLSARELGKALDQQFRNKNPLLQVNREFKKFSAVLPEVVKWLKTVESQIATQRSNSASLSAAISDVIQSLNNTLEGTRPSQALGMEQPRGPKMGFSRTLEADALVRYLTEPKAIKGGPLYSQTRAYEVASDLFDIRSDTLRKFKGFEPCNIRAAAVLAFGGLCQLGKLKEADKYFDVNALRKLTAKRERQKLVEN